LTGSTAAPCPVDTERELAKAHGVARSTLGSRDLAAVHVGAVRRVEILNLDPSTAEPLDLRVLARHRLVIKDQIVANATPDRHLWNRRQIEDATVKLATFRNQPNQVHRWRLRPTHRHPAHLLARHRHHARHRLPHHARHLSHARHRRHPRHAHHWLLHGHPRHTHHRLLHHHRLDGDSELSNLDIDTRTNRGRLVGRHAHPIDKDAVGAALVHDGGARVVDANLTVPPGHAGRLEHVSPRSASRPMVTSPTSISLRAISRPSRV
jgi:hypothetical protein